jgi:hypothetical protein
MRGVWAEISEEEIISAYFVQGKKNSFLVCYTPVQLLSTTKALFCKQFKKLFDKINVNTFIYCLWYYMT